jgi:hypothetical protein
LRFLSPFERELADTARLWWKVFLQTVSKRDDLMESNPIYEQVRAPRGLMLAALGAALLAVPTGLEGAGAQGLTTLVVAAPPTQDTAPLLYAMKEGLFEKAGLSVQLQQLQNGAAISAAMIGGSVEVGLSSVPGLIVAHSRGVPFQIIFPTVVYSSADPYAMMFVRKDSTIRTARDLSGKTLASPALKDLDWTANMAWIDRNGGDPKSVSSVELPTSALLPALLDGRIDAYTIGQPWVAVALGRRRPRLGESAGPRSLVRRDRAALFAERLVLDLRYHRTQTGCDRDLRTRHVGGDGLHPSTCA